MEVVMYSCKSSYQSNGRDHHLLLNIVKWSFLYVCGQALRSCHSEQSSTLKTRRSKWRGFSWRLKFWGPFLNDIFCILERRNKRMPWEITEYPRELYEISYLCERKKLCSFIFSLNGPQGKQKRRLTSMRNPQVQMLVLLVFNSPAHKMAAFSDLLLDGSSFISLCLQDEVGHNPICAVWYIDFRCPVVIFKNQAADNDNGESALGKWQNRERRS